MPPIKLHRLPIQSTLEIAAMTRKPTSIKALLAACELANDYERAIARENLRAARPVTIVALRDDQRARREDPDRWFW